MSTEQRKSARKAIDTAGFLFTFDGRPIGACKVKDVSVGGARLMHAIADEVPKEFWLSLSRNGRVRRHCQVAWRAKSHIGVRFISTSSE
jgi:PilZ domain-containing protein